MTRRLNGLNIKWHFNSHLNRQIPVPIANSLLKNTTEMTKTTVHTPEILFGLSQFQRQSRGEMQLFKWYLLWYLHYTYNKPGSLHKEPPLFSREPHFQATWTQCTSPPLWVLQRMWSWSVHLHLVEDCQHWQWTHPAVQPNNRLSMVVHTLDLQSTDRSLFIH